MRLLAYTRPEPVHRPFPSPLVSPQQVLQRRYLENVPAIVPLLEREYRQSAARLEATRAEMDDLQHDKLKVAVCGRVEEAERGVLKRSIRQDGHMHSACMLGLKHHTTF